MTDHDKVDKTYITLFGVEGQGGLVRKVDEIDAKVEEHDRRLNTISIKWMALLFAASLIGNALGQDLSWLSRLF